MAVTSPPTGEIEPINARCRKCGRLLRVTSLPAMCPICRMPVAVPQATPLTRVPVYPPPGAMDPPPSKRFAIPPWLLPVAGGVAVIVLLFFIADDLRLRVAKPTAAPPAATVAPPPPAPSPPSPSQEAIVPTPEPTAVTPPTPTTLSAAAIAPPPPPPPPHPFASLAALDALRNPPANALNTTDDRIAAAISRGANFMRAQFSGSRLKDADNEGNDRFEGLDTLCVYALLQAGLTLEDPTLRPQAPFASGLLEKVKSFPMTGGLATYGRSLRLAALSLFSRPADRAAIEKDFAWMLRGSVNGAYTYTYNPADKTPRSPTNWDNSNSQYGALGVWAAAEAGFKPAGTYWQEVTQHWENSQLRAGGWSYAPSGQAAALSMTAAGVSILFVARDQSAADNGLDNARPTPLSPSIQNGLEWLDEADHSITFYNDHPGYTLYGLERAGLASGYKFFGTHDWYLELANRLLKEQLPNGSWDGGDGVRAETAFRLLFLSRGRHPIFVSKLRYDGDWAFRPRDVASLTQFAGAQLEVPLNWQTVGMERSALEWSDSPVLFLSGAMPPTVSDTDVDKLRAYIQAGGLLFTMANASSPAFTDFAKDLAHRLFADIPMQPISADHPLYSALFPLKPDPASPLLGVSNGTRLLMVHSPTDLARRWNPRYAKNENADLQLGANIVLYGAGRRDLRHRGESLNIPAPEAASIAAVPMARVVYGGNWNPEPDAWTRMAKWMDLNTGFLLDLRPIAARDLQATNTPIAHLTGTATVQFSADEIEGLTRFVRDGGVLLIDSCGGSPAFAAAVQSQFISKLGSLPEIIHTGSPLWDTAVAGMRDLSKPRLRNFAEQSEVSANGQMQRVHYGLGDVIVTPLDLTSGLLGTHTWGIIGYEPGYAQAVVNNVIVWGVKQAGRIIGKSP